MKVKSRGGNESCGRALNMECSTETVSCSRVSVTHVGLIWQVTLTDDKLHPPGRFRGLLYCYCSGFLLLVGFLFVFIC